MVPFRGLVMLGVCGRLGNWPMRGCQSPQATAVLNLADRGYFLFTINNKTKLQKICWKLVQFSDCLGMGV
jgi:hypothetical protein